MQFISNDALTCPRSISSITTQSILLSRHATVWINHWTRTCTPCNVAFEVDQLSRLIENDYLVKIYLLSVNIYETPTFQDFFIVIFLFLEGGYQVVSSICKENIDIIWYDCHGNEKQYIFC